MGAQSLSYGFLNEIMDHPCSDGGLESDRSGCTKFNDGCTKFCERCTKCFEGCTKGSKVRFTVGIDPQSLSYGFLNEIMNHRCSYWGPGSDRIECTKFNKGCTKFNKECTKGSKLRSEVEMDPQSLSYGFLNEIMDHPCSYGGPRNDRIGCTKLFEGCTKGSKVRYEVGIGPQILPYGFQNELMDHTLSDGFPGSDRIGCTKFCN